MKSNKTSSDSKGRDHVMEVDVIRIEVGGALIAGMNLYMNI